MLSNLFTMVDRGVSRISPLNTLVDNVLNWVAPKMSASAATCKTIVSSQGCLKFYNYVYEASCGGAFGSFNAVAGFTSTRINYSNGRKIYPTTTFVHVCKSSAVLCPSSTCS